MKDWNIIQALFLSAPMWMNVMVDASLKGVVILSGAGLVTLLMRRGSAAARHLVWFLAVTSLLLLPVLAILLPGWQVLPRWVRFTREAVSTAVNFEGPVSVSSVPARPTPALTLDSKYAARSPARAPDATPLPIAGEQTESAPALTAPRAGGKGSLEGRNERTPPAHAHWAWVPVIWMSGMVVGLVPVFLGIISLCRLSRRSRCITEKLWIELLGTLSRQLRVNRPVVLMQGVRRSMPMAWGLSTSKILLPIDASDWSPDRKRAVLLHELAHLKRWDCFTQLLSRIACAAYWFNPLIWVALGRIVTERERACDDLVLTAGCEPPDYADHLLQIASGLQSSALAAYTAITMARKGALEGRLLAILDSKRSRRALTRLRDLIAVGMAACVLAPFAAMRQVAAARDDTEKDRAAEIELFSPWHATLPNGATVELVGVASNTSPAEAQTWWRPDGSKLADSPYERLGTYSNEKRPFELALRITRADAFSVTADGPLGTSVTEPRIPGRLGNSSADNVRGFVISRIGTGQDFITVRLGIATEQWETTESWRMPWATTVGNIGSQTGIVLTWPRQDGESVIVDATHTFLSTAARLVAVDQTGRLHEPEELARGSGRGLIGRQYRFSNLSLDQLDDLIFQTRPYQWVEFDNVSLRPGHNTSVGVKIGAPGPNAPRNKMLERTFTIRDVIKSKRRAGDTSQALDLASSAKGLVLHYTFDKDEGGKVIDQSGMANHAEVQGASWVPAGKVDGAYRFDGTDDYLKIPALAVNDLRSGTIAAWIYLNDNNEEPVITKQSDGENSYAVFTIGYYCRADGNRSPASTWETLPSASITLPPSSLSKRKTRTSGEETGAIRLIDDPSRHQGRGKSTNAGRLYWHGKNGVTKANSHTSVDTGKWYHVAVTFSSSEANFYINGVWDAANSGDYSVPDDLTVTDTRIGSWVTQGGYFNGMMDEVTIFSRMLSAEEIGAVYHSGISRSPRYEEETAGKGLVLHYAFDDDEGDTLTDHSGMGNAGEVHGGNWVEAGKVGGAYLFDGDDYIDAGNAESLQLTNDFTLMSWIYSEESGSAGIIAKSYGHPQQSRRAIEFAFSHDRKLSSYFWDSSTRFFAGGTDVGALSHYRWHHVVLQHDSSLPDHQMRVFINGVEQRLKFGYETVPSIPVVRNVTETMKIGCFRPGYHHFKGKIDEVRIYNRVLPADEVSRLYQKEGWGAQGGELPHAVRYECGPGRFEGGDSITISEVWGTKGAFAVGGTYLVKGAYKLESREDAILAFYVTATKPPGRSAVLPGQRMTLKKGVGEFELVNTFRTEGYPHISFYPSSGGSNFGGVYFGHGRWLQNRPFGERESYGPWR